MHLTVESQKGRDKPLAAAEGDAEGLHPQVAVAVTDQTVASNFLMVLGVALVHLHGQTALTDCQR